MLEQNRAADVLSIDAADVVPSIVKRIGNIVAENLKRRGLVVGMSGGVDSSVCAGLAVRALGPKRVFGLMLPEADAEPEAVGIAQATAEGALDALRWS